VTLDHRASALQHESERLAWASRLLDDAAPAPPPHVDPGAARRLAARLDARAGFRAHAIVSALTRLGVGREAAKRWVAESIERRPALVERWDDWAALADREELRSRLEIAARCVEMPAALAPMVQFCFRASVADLYQPAAIALGRNRHRLPELERTVSEYFEQRSLAPEGAVILDGRRAPRRALILRAADPALVDGAALMAEVVREWPDQPADVSVALLAAETMLTRSVRHLPVVVELLERVAQLDARRLTRPVVQRIGALLSLAEAEGAADDTLLGAWRAVRERTAAIAWDDFDGSIGTAAAGLLRLDELLRCAARFERVGGAIWRELVAEPETMRRRWTLGRLLEWRHRERRAVLDAPAQAPESDAEGEWAAIGESRAMDARTGGSGADRSGSGGSGSSGSGLLTGADVARWTLLRGLGGASDGMERSSDAADLAALLAEISGTARWRSHDRPARAMLTILLIDLVLNGEMERDQVLALLDLERDGRGADAAAAHAHADDRGIGARRRDPLSLVLLRILSWEGAGAEAMIDARMLHRIDDPRVLLALVPSNRPTPLAASLADAIEHQIRSMLRASRGDSVTVLLRRLSVRRPHVELFDALREVTRDRAYGAHGKHGTEHVPGDDAAASALDMPALLEAARHDELPGAPVADWPEERGAPWALAAIRQEIRSYDAAEAEGRGIEASIDDLLRRIGRRRHADGADQGAAATLVDVLDALHGMDGVVLSEGWPAWRATTVREVQDDVDGMVARLHERQSALLPRSWSGWADMPEAVDAMQADLERLARRLAPLLPTAESRWLDRAISALIERLAQRAASMRSAIGTVRIADLRAEIDTDPRTDPRADGRANASADVGVRTLSDIAAVDETGLRERLHSTLLETLLQPAGIDHAEPWRRVERTLQWATRSGMVAASAEPRRASWHAACAALWRTAVQDAMSRQDDAGAIALLVDSRFRPLRSDAAGRQILDGARAWCHARLRLGTAMTIRREISPGPTGAVRETVGFIAHFSTVWLAMLIGCILMLDFGDAWKSMAEIGDVRGIAITFLIGVGGTYAYLLKTLRDRSHVRPEDRLGVVWASRCARAGAFLVVCLLYTVGMTTLFWLLLSSTDEVVHGPEAIGHIIVWAGFALFTGVFLGLLAGEAGET